MTRSALAAVLVIGRLTLAGPAPSTHVEYVEDLSRSELPHGITVLPVRGSPRAKQLGGYIFRFRDASFGVSPLDGKEGGEPDPLAIRAAILEEKVGDLYYVGPIEKGLLAWSGRIEEVGWGFLLHLDGKELRRPVLVGEHADAGGGAKRRCPGHLDRVRLDGRYLVETLDGRYALLRIVEMAPTFVVIQWVCQPSRARVFPIPKWRRVKYQPRATAAERLGYDAPRPTPTPRPPAPAPPEPRPALEDFPAGTTRHLADREKLIKILMEIVADRDGRASHLARGYAAEALGLMRAVEAAPLLASVIDAHLSHSQTPRDPIRPAMGSPYGAVLALVDIGKPGAAACLDALCKLSPEERPRSSKPGLLTSVIRRVEGKRGAELLLRERLAQTEDPKARGNLEHALSLLEAMR